MCHLSSGTSHGHPQQQGFCTCALALLCSEGSPPPDLPQPLLAPQRPGGVPEELAPESEPHPTPCPRLPLCSQQPPPASSFLTAQLRVTMDG